MIADSTPEARPPKPDGGVPPPPASRRVRCCFPLAAPSRAPSRTGRLRRRTGQIGGWAGGGPAPTGSWQAGLRARLADPPGPPCPSPPGASIMAASGFVGAVGSQQAPSALKEDADDAGPVGARGKPRRAVAGWPCRMGHNGGQYFWRSGLLTLRPRPAAGWKPTGRHRRCGAGKFRVVVGIWPLRVRPQPQRQHRLPCRASTALAEAVSGGRAGVVRNSEGSEISLRFSVAPLPA